MKFKNLAEATRYFADEKKCVEYLIQQRWNGKPVCPFCGVDKAPYVIEGGKRFKCSDKDCHKKFSVTVGTVFENTNIKLSTWFPAIYLITAHKKGISSHQLGRDLGITQKTAWFVLHRVREMLKVGVPAMLKTGMVEVDERSSEARNRTSTQVNVLRRLVKSVQTNNKTMVVGVLERGGKVYAQKVERADTKNLITVITNNVSKQAEVVRDSYPAYQLLPYIGFNHHVIDRVNIAKD